MTSKPRVCLVIGASRGLGAALVEGLLNRGFERVIGVSRTPLDSSSGQSAWVRSGRYRHVQLDITSEEAGGRIRGLTEDLPSEPLLVIYNAAVVRSDVQLDGTIDVGTFGEVNAVGVTGFGHVLSAVQRRLLAYGGVLVGISSFAALAPPLRDPRVAYPASKAYLDAALRSLRHAWRGKVLVVTVHLGHLGGSGEGILSRWVRPSYAMAAERILRALTRDHVPREINYTFLYAVVYKYILPFVPDSLYFFLAARLFNQGSMTKPRT